MPSVSSRIQDDDVLRRGMALRVAGVAVVSGAIWIQQLIQFDRELFLRPGYSLAYRSAELLLCGVLLGFAAFARRLGVLRWGTGVALSVLALVHGAAMTVVQLDCFVPFMLTFTWGHIAIALVVSLTFAPGTLFLITTWLTATTVVVVRPDVPKEFNDLLVLVLVYGTILASIRSWDRLRVTAQEATSALHDAHAALLRSSQAQSRLFANLSHDFRTPLTLADNELQFLLSATECATTSASAVKRIRVNLATIAELTGQLLTAARLDAGRLEPQPRTFSALQLCHGVLAQFDGAHRTGRFRLLHEDTDWMVGVPEPSTGVPTGPLVRADPNHARRIITNLVANAAKQLEAGATRVALRVAECDGLVLVEVTDDGQGVPNKLRARLFERFAASELTPGAGLGLGLPLSRELASANGGCLDFVAHDNGAVFRLLLPRGTGPLDWELVLEPAAPAPLPPKSAEAPARRLLVVEDHAELRNQLLRGLSGDFFVAMANGVGDCSRALASQDFDVILTDLGLPDGDGFDVLTAVGTLPQSRRVPVVFLSGIGDEDIRVAALAKGAADWVDKPFSFSELSARLRGVCDRHATQREELRRRRDLLQAELHDGVNGSLVRAIMLLDAAGASLSTSLLTKARSAVHGALEQARALLVLSTAERVLWPALVASAEQSALSVLAGFALSLRFVTSSDDSVADLDATTAHALHRAVVETTLNAMKYAEGELLMDLTADRGMVRLRVESHGESSDGPSTRLGSGRGLQLLTRRFDALRGGLRTERSEGAFAVTAWVPRTADDL